MQMVRNFLQDWHAGQASAMYAAASSGLVESPDRLLGEISYLKGSRDADLDAEEKAAIQWLEERLDDCPIVTVKYRNFTALPWAEVLAEQQAQQKPILERLLNGVRVLNEYDWLEVTGDEATLEFSNTKRELRRVLIDLKDPGPDVEVSHVKKTIVQLTILHEDAGPENRSLADIAYEINEGSWLGQFSVISTTAVPKTALEAEASELGGDASFFLSDE